MQDMMEFFRNHPILVVVWVILLFFLLGTFLRGLTSKVKTVTRNEAIMLMNKHNGIVIDIRTRDEFRSGHISGSVNAPAAEIKQGNTTHLDKYREVPVIVTCVSGLNSQEAAESLSRAGFNDVKVLKDGINGWNSENLPLVRGK